jgi:hypothetical protein
MQSAAFTIFAPRFPEEGGETWGDMRFSISWKASGYADEVELRAVRGAPEDLAPSQILELLVADLRRRGRLQGENPDGRTPALLFFEESVRLPPAPEV